MKPMRRETEMTFEEALRGLIAGDFSRLAPLFETQTRDSLCSIIRWYESGLFDSQPKALEEAFTCACFNGCTEIIAYFLTKGVNPDGGINTSSNAFHWAANRGQLKTVEILIRNKASLETQNSYGATVLGSAVWSAVHDGAKCEILCVKIRASPAYYNWLVLKWRGI
jgi:Ankyrin repeats (3 copies)